MPKDALEKWGFQRIAHKDGARMSNVTDCTPDPWVPGYTSQEWVGTIWRALHKKIDWNTYSDGKYAKMTTSSAKQIWDWEQGTHSIQISQCYDAKNVRCHGAFGEY